MLSDRQAGRGRPHPKGRNAVEDRAKAVGQSELSRTLRSKRARLRTGAAGLKWSATHPANTGNGQTKPPPFGGVHARVSGPHAPGMDARRAETIELSWACLR